MSDLDIKIAAIRAGLGGVTPGPWQALRYDPAEGVNCHWIKAQPSPALRGFSKEVAYVEGTYYADGSDARDAAHIARLDPDTVRAILDRLDAVTRGRNLPVGACASTAAGTHPPGTTESSHCPNALDRKGFRPARFT